MLGFITRPQTAEVGHTLANIQENEDYTINHIHQGFIKNAHYTSAKFPADTSEFKRCSLTEEYIEDFKAPFVKESQLKYAVKLQEIMPVKLNNTLIVIGEITDILCNNSAIQLDGYVDIESLNTVMVSGLDSYHTSNRLSRLHYAKPNTVPTPRSLNGEIES